MKIQSLFLAAAVALAGFAAEPVCSGTHFAADALKPFVESGGHSQKHCLQFHVVSLLFDWLDFKSVPAVPRVPEVPVVPDVPFLP